MPHSARPKPKAARSTPAMRSLRRATGSPQALEHEPRLHVHDERIEFDFRGTVRHADRVLVEAGFRVRVLAVERHAVAGRLAGAPDIRLDAGRHFGPLRLA